MTTWESNEVAAAWSKRADERKLIMVEATAWMLAEARIRPGARVLDLGTGTGDTALLLSDCVGPSGSVVATDASPAMVAATAESLRAAGVTNATTRTLDAAAIDVTPGAFDAVIARLVLMFVDRDLALRGIARALRPGGRVAIVAWASPDRNPFQDALLTTAQARGVADTSGFEIAKAFSCGDEARWRAELAAIGFRDVSVRRVPTKRCFDSIEKAVEGLRTFPVTAAPIEALPVAQRDAAWADITAALRPFEGGTGVEIPAELLVIAGEKPT